ncbi:PREDICTED: valine--tRNA ligase-like isoform X1 [Polistes canadensis]|uniref:valine--tRNA ligase-like isoform X1 n=2 Tax=Polistes canadensis TaxID=91411 RepID=UPI000718B12B|nr:PREDICTED: valine--tRNA ligase-like isoform X1 [Polistes canadensis]XP_014598392.1 PREDICTED: valine--tRNA ligase-like isoform X1 [Polistes canadensis]
MNVIRLQHSLRAHLYKCIFKSYCSQKLNDFPKSFPSKDVLKWYQLWEKNNFFNLQSSNKDPFKMILPPPNVTGTLHIGHALTATIQDVLARWYRMKGHPVIWIPGLDHAGIATQAVVEKYLYKTKGCTKMDIGKKEFLSFIWEWKNEKESVIKDQLRLLGTSVDWSKEYFTMSKNHNFVVTEALIKLNDKNMLYRDKDLINWSSSLQSAISDIEVESIELTGTTELEVPGYKKKVKFGQLSKIAFQIKDSDNELIIATTRPETLLGDVAIAVHPEDNRYNKYISQYVWHDLRETFIPIIGDTSVNRTFGTGVVKITPAHDRLDYKIAKKHGLRIIDTIDEHGNIITNNNNYKGLPKFLARDKMLNELANKGLLRGIESHKMILPRCSRSGDIIEYLLKEQWFIRCKDMAEKALQVVKDGSLKIDPTIYEPLWYNWLENIRDWCISRQLWWGHQIPAYEIKNDETSEWIIARSKEDALFIAHKKYGSNVEVRQDNDVLDTWFSSALLPLTTMGWLRKMEDFQKYYPLTLMETGHDILFFWVARMVMLGLELTGQLPFKEVLLHGILCDAQGKKISKSFGNVISPESIINGTSLQDLNAKANESYKAGILNKNELKRTLIVNGKMFPNGISTYGVDALRMTLCAHNIKNRTVSFNIIECQQNYFFCNKIWQASKYVLLTISSDKYHKPEMFTTLDSWILSRLSLMVNEVNTAFTERNFYKAVAVIKQFIYYEFCDIYLEATKWGFKSGEELIITSHIYTLIKCLEVSLRVLTPITPFLTDELYSRLSKKLPSFLSLSSLSEAPYPTADEFKDLRNESLDKRMKNVLDLITEIRSFTANISKKLEPEVHIVVDNLEDHEFYTKNINLIKGASRIWNVSIHLKENYVKNIYSIQEELNSKHSLFLSVKNKSTLDHILEIIEKRKKKAESKLKKSIKL